MTLLQRSRFGTWLKNVTGFRGPAGLDVGEVLSPVYDLASYDELLDDETAYWISSSATVGPVAGQVSSITVQFPAAAKVGTRASVDGLYIRSAVAAVVYQFGLCAAVAGGANPCNVRNNFLGQRGSAIDASTAFSALNLVTRSGAASIFTGFSTNHSIDAAAGLHCDLPTPFPVFVITPGFSFAVECQTLNTAISAFLWGRYLGDQT